MAHVGKTLILKWCLVLAITPGMFTIFSSNIASAADLCEGGTAAALKRLLEGDENVEANLKYIALVAKQRVSDGDLTGALFIHDQLAHLLTPNQYPSVLEAAMNAFSERFRTINPSIYSQRRDELSSYIRTAQKIAADEAYPLKIREQAKVDYELGMKKMPPLSNSSVQVK